MEKTDRLMCRFKKALAECTEGAESPSVLAAISGGADSTALLLLLAELQKEEDLRVEAFHLNHMIRGEEADRDEVFCRRLCGELHIPFISRRENIPEIGKKRKKGLEECAREVRYEALEAVRSQRNLQFIATAHNGEDQLETLLFRMTRGSGLKGLCGIPRRRGTIIRPLLSFGRSELEELCAARGIEYMTDSTNKTDDYSRNRLRHRVVPVLKTLNKEVVPAVVQMAENLREDEELLSSLVPPRDADRETLRSTPLPLVKRWLFRAYEEYTEERSKKESAGKGSGGCRKGEISNGHLQAMCSLLMSGKTGDALSLPGKVKMLSGGERVIFTEDRDRSKEQTYCVIPRGKPQPVGGTGLVVCLTDRRTFDEFSAKNRKIHSLFMKVALNSATIDGELRMRPRKAGDKIAYGGMTREVSKLVAARCKDPLLRSCYPVLCDGKGVAWVPGYPAREDLRPKEGEQTVYILIGDCLDELS